jgi:hypothetical protein
MIGKLAENAMMNPLRCVIVTSAILRSEVATFDNHRSAFRCDSEIEHLLTQKARRHDALSNASAAVSSPAVLFHQHCMHRGLSLQPYTSFGSSITISYPEKRAVNAGVAKTEQVGFRRHFSPPPTCR